MLREILEFVCRIEWHGSGHSLSDSIGSRSRCAYLPLFLRTPRTLIQESLALCMRNKIIRKSGQCESEAEWETLTALHNGLGRRHFSLTCIVFSTGRTHAVYFFTNVLLEFLHLHIFHRTHWSKYNSFIIKSKICSLPLATFLGFYVFHAFYFNFYICLIEYYVL